MTSHRDSREGVCMFRSHDVTVVGVVVAYSVIVARPEVNSLHARRRPHDARRLRGYQSDGNLKNTPKSVQQHVIFQTRFMTRGLNLMNIKKNYFHNKT